MGFKGLADLVSRLATFFVTVYLARKLLLEDFGLFSYAWALALSWIMLMDLGWNSVLMQRAKESNFKSLFFSVVFLKLVVLVALLMGSFFFKSHFSSPALFYLFLLGVCYTAGFSFQDLQGAAVAGLERFDLEWILKFIPRWLPVLVMVMGMTFEPSVQRAAACLGLAGLGLSLLVTAGLGFIILKGPWNVSTDTTRQIILQGIPFGVAALVWGAYSKLDIILLKVYGFTLSQIGIYSAAAKIIDFCRGLAIIVYISMIPILSDYKNDFPKLRSILFKVAFALLGAAIVVCPLLWWIVPKGIHLIYGAPFQEASLPLFIGMVGILLLVVNTPFQAALIALGRGRMVLVGSILLLVTCFAVNMWLLPGGKLTAPAWAILAGEAMWLVSNAMFLHRRIR